MAEQLGITIVKTMSYRGDPTEEWSNTYWFSGAAPTTSAEAQSLARALATEEAALYLGTCTAVRAYVYTDNAPHTPAAYVVDFASTGGNIGGTMTTGSDTYPAGDQAAWVRWKTERLTSKGKAIYLRKYYHGVPTVEESPINADNVHAAWRTAALAFGNTLQTAVSGHGSIAGQGHPGEAIDAHSASTFITTRTLKRRGKRPPA